MHAKKIKNVLIALSVIAVLIAFTMKKVRETIVTV